MLALALLAAVHDPAPKTFRDLEIAKIEAVHNIKTFHLKMTVKGDGLWFQTMNADLLSDGSRSHATLGESANGQSIEGESVDDGSTSWVIIKSQKAYVESKDSTKPFDPTSLLLKTEPHSINFAFQTGSQFGFATDPPIELKSLDTVHNGDETLRCATAFAKSEHGQVTVTQWFLPDRWILKRFTVRGTNQDGAFSMDGEATLLDFSAKVTAKDFALDPAKIEGYQRQEPPTDSKGSGGI